MSAEVLIPLESNPEVMNKYLHKLGVPSDWSVVDVMGLDEELLLWVPRPVLAVMLLFPVSEAYEKHKVQEEREILAKGQKISPNIFYVKQNIRNACGTFALLHSVANNTDSINLNEGIFKTFIDEAKDLDPVARGELLKKPGGVLDAHKEFALTGQTKVPSAEDLVNHHFITFVHKDGALYELDGSKAFPVNHGPTTPDSLLEDAAKVCQMFMKRDPNDVCFTVLALAATD